MNDYDDLQIALNVARDNLKSLNDKIGREQFRFVCYVLIFYGTAFELAFLF